MKEIEVNNYTHLCIHLQSYCWCPFPELIKVASYLSIDVRKDQVGGAKIKACLDARLHSATFLWSRGVTRGTEVNRLQTVPRLAAPDFELTVVVYPSYCKLPTMIPTYP